MNEHKWLALIFVGKMTKILSVTVQTEHLLG